MREIYIIHCFLYKNDRTVSSYNVGWYNNFALAEDVILNNKGDIFEHYYNYALIELVKEGHAKCEVLAWYVPNWINDRCLSATRIPTPEVFKNIINFSMG